MTSLIGWSGSPGPARSSATNLRCKELAIAFTRFWYGVELPCAEACTVASTRSGSRRSPNNHRSVIRRPRDRNGVNATVTTTAPTAGANHPGVGEIALTPVTTSA